MKRLNPATGLPFKHGYIREDGLVFYQYSVAKPKLKTGYFNEIWITPKRIQELAEESKRRSAESRIDPKGRALRLVYSAKRRAFKNNQNFSLSIDDISSILEKNLCQLTGLCFDLSPPKKGQHNPYAPSLDRIDSSKGYTKNNTRVVLVAVNQGLNEYGEQIMLPILEAMVKGIKKNAKKI